MNTSELAYQQLVEQHKEGSLSGRWIPQEIIVPLLKKSSFLVTHVGNSEENRPIFTITAGYGPKKILIWSQMHGNESTGTKAIFDILNILEASTDRKVITILKECTLTILPMLNPDGAEQYTRVNANGVDLNRDAVDRTAKESKILRNILDEIQPDFCFNLHDQRTIFGVEGTQNPATLSFLAPSEEETRKITPGRIATMDVIVAMNQLLQQYIPNHIGRYTDAFYPTATGDNFQKLGYPTILIESGHYPEDYEREITRKYTGIALFKGLHHIATQSNFTSYQEYFDIPNNEESFVDLIHRYPDTIETYQYEELLIDGKFSLQPQKVTFDSKKMKFFHKEIVFVN